MKSETLARSAPRLSTGFWWGLCTGVVVWAAHIAFQATQTFGSLFGDFLIPVLAVLTIGALLAAVRSTVRRKWWLGVSGGIVLTVPIALAIFGIVIVVVHPE